MSFQIRLGTHSYSTPHHSSRPLSTLKWVEGGKNLVQRTKTGHSSIWVRRTLNYSSCFFKKKKKIDVGRGKKKIERKKEDYFDYGDALS